MLATQGSVGRLTVDPNSPQDAVKVKVAIASIRPSPTNPRVTFDEAELQKLAKSIEKHGVLQPPLVRPLGGYIVDTDPERSLHDLGLSQEAVSWLYAAGMKRLGDLVGKGKYLRPKPKTPVSELIYEALKSVKTIPLTEAAKVRDSFVGRGTHTHELVDGERRFRAAQIAGLDTIDCHVRELSDREVLEIQLVANEQREDVLPLERAVAYGRLVDAGATISEISEAISQSESTVRQILLLRNIPKSLSDAVNRGEVKPYTASLVGRVPGTQRRERLAYFIVNRVDPDIISKERFGSNWKPCNFDMGTDALTTRDVEGLIAEFCMVELGKRATFSLKMAGIADTPSCEACPKLAANGKKEDPEGFKAIRNDICTDPSCFEVKQKAHAASVAAEAAAGGRKVIAGEEAEKLFDRWSPGVLRYGCGYVDIGTHLPPSATPKRMSYAKALKGFPAEQLVTIIDPESRAHIAAPYEAAAAFIKKTHNIKLPAVGSSAGARAPKSDNEKKEEAKRREEQRLHRDTYTAIVIRAGVEGGLSTDFPAKNPIVKQVLRAPIERVLAKLLITRTSQTSIEALLRARGLKQGRRMDNEEALTKLADSLEPGKEIFGFLTEILASMTLLWGDWSQKLAKELGQALDLDRKAIANEVRSRLKEGKARG
jgi:ParB/RepB/Spo0J family partition protein